MSKYSKEDNTCRHRIIGNSKKLTCFILLFLHSKKYLMAVALSAVDAKSGLDPLRHSLKHKACSWNVHISGAWLCDCEAILFIILPFVTIPLAIVLNAVRAALLACMQWNDEGDLSDEKKI